MRFQRDLLLPGLVAATDVAWMGLWFRLLLTSSDGQAALGYGAQFVSMALAAWLTRLSTSRDWTLLKTRIAAIGSGLVCALVNITLNYGSNWPMTLGPFFRDPLLVHSGPIMGLLISLFLWWWGLRLGSLTIDSRVVEDRFRNGAIGLIVLAIAFAVSRPVFANQIDSPAMLDLPSASLLFFAFSLAGLALTRFRAASRVGPMSSSTAPRWLLSVAVSIGLILAVGLVLVAILPNPVGGLAGLLAPLPRMLALLDPILLALLYPLALLVEALITLIARMSARMGVFQIVQPENPDQRENLNRLARAALTPDQIRLIEWLIVVLAIVAAGVIVWRAIRKRRKLVDDDLQEVRESVWSWQTFWNNVAAVFRRWLGRSRGSDRAVAASSQAPDSIEARTIRECYRAYLRAAARIGLPRNQAQTPLEYQILMTGVLGQQSAATAELTDAYVVARYGPSPIDDRLVERARSSWNAIESALVRGRIDGNRLQRSR